MDTPFTRHAGVSYPIIGGAMFPCSNPELVAAVSEAGGLGIIQPLSLVYVFGYEFREGLKLIKSLTSKPVGINIILEKSQKAYEKRLRQWLDIAIDEGVRFAITALGNPDWVVKAMHNAGGVVYHDAVSASWAKKALDKGVDGLICVNNRAGGHAGALSAEELYRQLSPYKVPLVCAGGVGDPDDFVAAMKLGYAAVQMGTRFIATTECREKDNYKQAIVNAGEDDIVLTERVTGIPLSVIRTPYVDAVGTKVGPVARFLLQHRHTKHWMRFLYQIRAAYRCRRTTLHGGSSRDYLQAGKSVHGIHSVEPVQAIVAQFMARLKPAQRPIADGS